MLEVGHRIEVAGYCGVIDEIRMDAPGPPDTIAFKDPYGVTHEVLSGLQDLPDVWIRVRIDDVKKKLFRVTDDSGIESVVAAVDKADAYAVMNRDGKLVLKCEEKT